MKLVAHKLAKCILPALWAGSLSIALGGELPGGDGKLDYGIEGLPIPLPRYNNVTPARTAELLKTAISEQKAAFAKAQLIVELGGTRLPAAVPIVTAALSDANAEIRAAGAFAFVALADTQSPSAESRQAVLADASIARRLVELLKDHDEQVATSALQALDTIEGSDGPAVGSAIGSGDGPLLAEALRLAFGPKAADAIVARFGALNETMKISAMGALARCKSAAALPLIQAAADSKNEAMQVAVCQAMRGIASPTSAPLARSLADSPRATVAREAVRAYGVCADVPDRVTLALVKLDNPDPTVRQAAVEVLGANLNPSVVASLVAQLSTDYRPLYLATRAALVSARDDATRDACTHAAGALLHSDSPRRQEDGSYVLGRYRSDYEYARHLQLLQYSSDKTDWPLMVQVVQSMGLIGRPEARKPLVNIVTHGAELERRGPGAVSMLDNAFIAAGRVGASEAIPACGPVLAHFDPRTSDFNRRAAAVFLIGVCGNAQTPEIGFLDQVLATQMDAKIEVIKAYGNLKLKDAVAKLESPYPMSQDYQNRWLAQWAIARIRNEPAQHPVTVYPWAASSTSYKDLSGK